MADSNVDVDALLGSVYQENGSTPLDININSDKNNSNSDSKKRERENSSDIRSPERKRRRISSERSSPDERRYKEYKRSPSPLKRRPRSPLRRREKTPPELSPESQAEQDARTVFVTGLPTYANENDIKPFFEQAGKVKVISLIGYDRATRRSKGIGYIQYENASSIPNALGLNGTKYEKHTIVVQATMAEKNRLIASAPRQLYKLLATNLDPRLCEDDILYFFEQVGSAKTVEFTNEGQYNNRSNNDNSRRKTKQAIISFRKSDDAKKAVEFCNGFKFIDYVISVEHYQSSSFLYTGSGEARIDLDADDQGIKLDGATRVALMQRLSQRPTITNEQPTKPAPVLAANIPKSDIPTIFIVLKNMFDPSEAIEDPELFDDVKEAVTEECTKFGAVEDIFTDENSPDGLVYIQLDSVKAAEQTKDLLNGRWYAGKMVSVDYISASVYRTRRAQAQR